VASLEQIRDAVKTTIAHPVIDGMRCHATFGGVVNAPATVVVPVTADFVVAMGRGADTWELDLVVVVPYGDERTAQNKLDSYVTGAGASSIRQVIFANRTLGLASTDAHIARMSKYGELMTIGQVEYLTATLRLTVHTTGTA